MRHENLSEDFYNLLEKRKINVYPSFKEAIFQCKVFNRRSDIPARKQIEKDVNSDHKLCKRIREFEFFLTENYYS